MGRRARFGGLWQYLTDRGVQFQHECHVDDAPTSAASRVQTDSGKPLDADAVVLAADVSGLQRIVDASPTVGDQPWRSRVEAMRAAPPFVVQRMWVDRPADAQLKSLSRGLQLQPTLTTRTRDRSLVASWLKSPAIRPIVMT